MAARGVLALLFALFHRHSYSGCKPAIGDLLLGTAALAAEVNNVHKASHVREKLAESIMTNGVGLCPGYTASDLDKPASLLTGHGSCPLWTGILYSYFDLLQCGPLLVGRSGLQGAEILCDIAGGKVGTFPHEKDFMNPETKDLLLKYTKRNSKISAGGSSPVLAVPGRHPVFGHRRHRQSGNYHGGGSPIMEQIAITSQYDIESRKKLVRYIAGMSGGDREALSKQEK